MAAIQSNNRKTTGAVMVAVGLILLPGAPLADPRLFENPTVDGYAMDRCRDLNLQCDWPAADTFCQANGYSYALDWTWAYKARTLTISTRTVCETRPGTVCGGFLDITCAGTPGPAPVAPTAPVFDPAVPVTDTGTPGPAPAIPFGGNTVVFTGAIHDYAIAGDPDTGGWTVTDIRPGGPDGTVQVPPGTQVLQFADGTLSGTPAVQPDTEGPGPAAVIPGFEDPVPPGPLTVIPGTPPAPVEPAPGPITEPLNPGTEDPGFNSGAIVATIERPPYECRDGGKIGQRFVHCKIAYSLENTSGAPIFWTSGEWETNKDDGNGMDRRNIGYRTAALQPADKQTYEVWCSIPDGYVQGIWSAWGAGSHRTSGEDVQFTWRLSASCP